MIKHRILKNFSWLLFDKIIKVFLGLFVASLIARHLGPKYYGILNYSLAYISLFLLFSKMGLDQIVVRELVKNPHTANELLGTTFTLKLLGSCVAIAMIFFSLLIIDTDQETGAVVLIVSAAFVFQSFDVIDYYYQSKVLSKYTVIARSSAFISTSLLQIYFVFNNYSVIYFAAAYSLNFLFAALLLAYVYKKMGSSVRQWKFSIQKTKELMVFSWPLAISIFIMSIHARIDQVMIGNMLGSEQVGIYSTAVVISEFWYFIPVLLVNSLMPYFVKLRENNKKLYEARLTQLYSMMFWIGFIIGVFAIAFGDEVIILIFGDSYSSSYSSLVISIWNGIFISQAVVRGIWMISENLQKYRLYINLLVVTLNVLLNYLLIPRLGIAGAAISTLITQSLGTWCLPLFWKPIRHSSLDMIRAINPCYLYKIGMSLRVSLNKSFTKIKNGQVKVLNKETSEK